MKNRNTSKEEVIETIRNSGWNKAKGVRFSAKKTFNFDSEHFDRYYTKKDVVPIFVEESERIIVITVYTFYY